MPTQARHLPPFGLAVHRVIEDQATCWTALAISCRKSAC